MVARGALAEEAVRFVRLCHGELGKPADETESRVRSIGRTIAETDTYEHTAEELEHGARMAWRNSNRCIGRLFWQSLQVRDARGVESEADVARACFEHIEAATNGGKIVPTLTVFRAEAEPERTVRIRNAQLIRYAGYETERGIVGDPISTELTKACTALGWRGEGTPFDVLPLIIQIGRRRPVWFELPKELVLEVPIRHPELPAFADLGLKWYGVPLVSDMRLEIGGLSYTAAPFNGWYMGTEIGARNLADERRYDLLPKVAETMGLERGHDSTLWKDRALVELNAAVLHSYKERGVSIVDHHTAAKQFRQFEEREVASGRSVTGDWTWLIPPLSPATTPIFHKSYSNETVNPNYHYQRDRAWMEDAWVEND